MGRSNKSAGAAESYSNDYAAKMNKSQFIEWVFRCALLIVTSVGGFLAKEVWDGQRQIVSRLNAMDVSQAAATASRFTVVDWAIAKNAIDAQINIEDRRISKLESLAEQSQKSLDRIEVKIGTMKP